MEPTRLGPFVVERELGRGGMGVVYAARLGGRRVALKVALDDVSPRDREHFLQEAELCARVSHPAVIELLDSGTLDDGRPYLVMPLVEGETLGARVGRGRLDPELSLRLFNQLAGAVAALHDAGIVHRDIKPENVMYIEAEERLVLLDFGIAREIDRPASTTTRMNLVRGTPGCMAPERFFGVRASAASDVYELGVVLYAMVAGQLPWDEPTDPEARLRPRHPAELGIDLPVGLGHLLLETLSSRPERRPSARELAVRVRAIGGTASTPGGHGRTTLAHPVHAERSTLPIPMDSPPPRARSVVPPPLSSPTREMPAGLWLAGALAVTGIAVGGSLWVRTHRPGVALYARSGLGTRALGASLYLDPTPSTPSRTEQGSAEQGSEAQPASPVHAALTVSLGAPVATAPPATSVGPAAGAPVVTGLPWCTRLIELYCTPALRARPGGEERCATERADLARTKELSPTMQAHAEDGCRDAIPSLRRSLDTPQASEAAADLPNCKRVVAVYCSPEVKNSYGGEGMCSQAQQAWGSRLAALAADDRAKKDAECARMLPAVTQAMRQHVKDLGPGTAASARLSAPRPPSP